MKCRQPPFPPQLLVEEKRGKKKSLLAPIYHTKHDTELAAAFTTTAILM